MLNTSYSCATCNCKIHNYESLLMCCDANVCSMKCLNKRYKNVLKIDPKMKNPSIWKKVKKTESNLGMYMNQIDTKKTVNNSLLGNETLGKKVLTNELLKDKVLFHNVLSNKVLLDKVLSDKELSNKVLSNKVLSDKILSNKVLSDKILNDKVLSDETIIFNLDKEDQISNKYTITNSIWIILKKYIFICTGINVNIFIN